MARPLRIEIPGGLYHVTSRGDRREEIYLFDADREIWLQVFGDVCRRYNWVCHAYCLMDNHYHIVVETAEGNLARGMRHLNGVYTQGFNRSYGRIGHVFQGRYKGILIEKDRYLLELARYVVLNPVRASMVTEVGNWQWSSYRAMIGEAECPTWLASAWLLGQFNHDRKVAVGEYVDFVRAGLGLPRVWAELRNQIYLGGERFVDQMKQTVSAQLSLDEVPRTQHRRVDSPLKSYLTSHADPKEGMAKAYLSGDYTMKEISLQFGVHYSTVSRAVKAFEARISKE